MIVSVITKTAGTAKYPNVVKVEYCGKELYITLNCKDYNMAVYPISIIADIVIEPEEMGEK